MASGARSEYLEYLEYPPLSSPHQYCNLEHTSLWTLILYATLSVSASLHGQAPFHNAQEVQIRSTLASVIGTRLASSRLLDYASWPSNLKLPVCMQEVVHRVAARGTIDVRVDGPYGYASEPEWTLYDTVVMVAGGIGVSFLHCLGPTYAHYPCTPYILLPSQKMLILQVEDTLS